ncbi:MAG: N-acetyltransferase family protein [Acidimicrobiia bacterium]
MTVTVRDCGDADLVPSLAIYDQSTDTTTIAWTEHRTGLADWTARIRDQQARGFPVLVAVDAADGAVVGFASYDHFRDSDHWEGYRFTVELSIHVRLDRRGEGIGRDLMQALLARAREQGLHVVVAAIDGDNEDSIRFHERCGFVTVARMPEVGYKFGRRLDLVLMQRILRAG